MRTAIAPRISSCLRLAAVLGSLSLTALGCAAGDDGPAERIRMVDAGGHRLRMLDAGNGPVTVVLESGWSGGIGWEEVRAEVARFARVVTYDRAGTGGSEPGPAPRDARRVAGELRTALRNAGVAPPFVMVGHSLGGPFVCVFAGLYPDDVTGMVLVDPTLPGAFEPLPDLLAWLAEHRPEKRDAINEMLGRFPEGLRAGLASAMKHVEVYVADQPEADRGNLRRVLWNHLDEKVLEQEGQLRWMPRSALAELEAMDSTARQAREAWPLPVPIVLLSGLRPARKGPAEVRRMEEAARRATLADVEAWLETAPGSEHIKTSKSGHNIQDEEPKLVIDAIRRVVDRAAQAGRPSAHLP